MVFFKGFRLKYTGSRIHRESSNLFSAFPPTEALKDKIQKEINLGRIAGPFKFLPISNLQVSPCGHCAQVRWGNLASYFTSFIPHI